MLALLFAPQPGAAQPELINLWQALGDIYPALGASGPNDLIFWSSDELYRWFDDAQQRLARNSGVYVKRDTSITTTADLGSYSLPAGHVATIQADIGGLVLRARTVRELEALDSTWLSTTGPPKAFVQDTQGLQLIVIYPAPDAEAANAKVGIIERFLPAQINSSNAVLSAPQVIREFFTFSALAKARTAETKAAMPEVGQWFEGIAGVLEQAIAGYWGGPS